MVTVYSVDSELLQALDMCDNDPVGVARCFVMKVRIVHRQVLLDQNIKSFSTFILKKQFDSSQFEHKSLFMITFCKLNLLNSFIFHKLVFTH